TVSIAIIYYVTAISLNVMLIGFATYEHLSSDICGKNRIKAIAIHIDKFLENADAGIVHENVEMTESLQDFAIRADDVGFIGNIGPDSNRIQRLRGLVQLFLIPARDCDSRPHVDQHFRYCKSDAAASARHKRCCILQIHDSLPISCSKRFNFGRSPIAMSTSPAWIRRSAAGLNSMTPSLC